MYNKKTYTNGQVVNDAEVLNGIEDTFQSLYDEFNGAELWSNDAPTAEFAAQDFLFTTTRYITAYEIIYRHGITDAQSEIMSTGKIPVKYGKVKLQSCADHVYYRTVTFNQSSGECTFGISACTRRAITTSPANSTQNKFVIPIAIKVYYL